MRRPLSPTLAKLAEEELNETPDRIQQDIIILRVWIRQQPHLRARTEDDFLIAFLRRCRYSLEETKRRIDRYFTHYNLFPEVMSNRCITQRLLEINRLGVCLFPDLPKGNNRAALFVARFGHFDPNQYSLREIYHFTSMAVEIIALENDYASVAGICEIIDLEGANSDKMRRFDKVFFRKWWNFLHECSPLRVREVYVINMPKDIQSTILFLYNLLSAQVNYPIHVLKTPGELFEHIGKEYLPEEYGGTNGHMVETIAYMEDLLNSYRSYFEQDQQYGTIEELRAGEITTYEAEFGVNGSFRKLNWD
ncbi:alpha-tocopherol transfer protein-like [Drosophila nasuta]|uniref:Alpha-tocopherol transfer protein-like n=1 Tax=Drosophila albomicans TaxID=7291 RepID=A0A6P8XQP5_DROAB|nr:alpha-tocopherol transfer protein-like [Drosophila albomicans]XP_060649281.1 alpha-tocopherol transfer protein-like [Drosophila nasuta]